MNVTLPVASRAALHLRVSTTRQAEVDLSIPDQRLQTTAYCERQAGRSSPNMSNPALPPWTITGPSSSG